MNVGIFIYRPYWSVMGMGDVLEQVAAVADQMVLYNLHREELLLLQATVLVNAGKILICIAIELSAEGFKYLSWFLFRSTW